MSSQRSPRRVRAQEESRSRPRRDSQLGEPLLPTPTGCIQNLARERREEYELIMSIAQASVEDPGAEYIFGAWSNMVVGERPEGLVDCYLSQGDQVVYMVSVWESSAAHDRAIDDRETHPSYGFFEACGLEPTHTVYDVIGRMARH